jgi:hypothetical protein
MASDLTQLEILMMLKCFLEFLLMCFFVGLCHLDLRQLPGIKYRYLIYAGSLQIFETLFLGFFAILIA